MAEIRRFLFARHLRTEPSMHILHYRRGQLARSGPGLSFWFQPLSAGLAEVPLDDRELTFLFHGRSADFQDVTAQGVLTYRVVDPEALARRIDFTIGLKSGAWREQPLEKLSLLLTQLAQQIAWGWIAHTPVQEILAEGLTSIRERLEAELVGNTTLADMGLEVVTVRVSSVAPTPEVERALEVPTREEIQRRADEATFARRANAVEHERAIEENELNNRIELSKRREKLIDQEGANERREAEAQAVALKTVSEGESERARIDAEARAMRVRLMAAAEAERTRLEGEAEAGRVKLVEGANVEAELARIDIYRDLPLQVLMGLAARELAGNLERIDHLNLSPDALAPLLTSLMQAGTARLEAPRTVEE